jgi:hypothetical protein
MSFRKMFCFAIIYLGVISLFVLIVTEYSKAHAETNTVSSTVVTDKSVPTASAPSVVVSNNDVCKSAAAASVQTQILGVATGVTISDENCERLKLSRSLFAMGMKVAAVSTLCGDPRVFDSMWMAGTPCPFMGFIGDDAKASWKKNEELIPLNSEIGKIIAKENIEAARKKAKEDKEKEAEIKAAREKAAKEAREKARADKKKARKEARSKKGSLNGEKIKVWATPLGILGFLLLL